MGVSYQLLPFGEDYKEGMLEWLKRDWNIDCPSNIGTSRYPTPEELRQVLDSLEGYHIDYRSSAYIEIEKETDSTFWACIRDANNFTGFERGHPEVVLLIAEKLTAICGTLVVLINGESPILVTPGVNLEEAIKAWH